MMDTPNKGPIRFLEKQIKKYDKINNLETMAIQTPNICKWQAMKILTKNFPMNFGITLLLWTSKNHALSNFVQEHTWAKPKKQTSLVDKYSPPSPVLFVIHTNLIHGYMYYPHVDNNIYTHYTSKDITKQYGES